MFQRNWNMTVLSCLNWWSVSEQCVICPVMSGSTAVTFWFGQQLGFCKSLLGWICWVQGQSNKSTESSTFRKTGTSDSHSSGLHSTSYSVGHDLKSLPGHDGFYECCWSYSGLDWGYAHGVQFNGLLVNLVSYTWYLCLCRCLFRHRCCQR